MITTTIMVFLWLAGLYSAYKVGELRYQIKQTKQIQHLFALAKEKREQVDISLQSDDNDATAHKVADYTKFILDGLFNIVLGRPVGTSFDEEEFKP